MGSILSLKKPSDDPGTVQLEWFRSCVLIELQSGFLTPYRCTAGTACHEDGRQCFSHDKLAERGSNQKGPSDLTRGELCAIGPLKCQQAPHGVIVQRDGVAHVNS
jgi:hypothetical protein